MSKLPIRRQKSRRQKAADAGKTLIAAWPFIRLARRTFGLARFGPIGLLVAVVMFVRKRRRKAKEEAIANDPFAAPAPSSASSFAPPSGTTTSVTPDPAAPVQGTGSGTASADEPESDDAAPPRPADEHNLKPDVNAPASAS